VTAVIVTKLGREKGTQGARLRRLSGLSYTNALCWSLASNYRGSAPALLWRGLSGVARGVTGS